MINRYYFYVAETKEGNNVSGVTKYKSIFENPLKAMNQLKLNTKGLRMTNFVYLHFSEFKRV